MRRWRPGPLVVAAAVSLAAMGCVTTGARRPTATVKAPPPPPPPPAGPAMLTHEVEKGQTLYRIARAYGVSVEQLMDANRIVDPRELRVGERLYVPGATRPMSVEPWDAPEPEPPARRPEPPPPAGKKAAPPPKPAKTTRVGKGSGVLQWPLRGVIYARFGSKGREPHDGIDLAAPAGSPVKAAAEGKVLFAGEQQAYGLIVILEHEGDLITLYAHNRDLRVRTGQEVKAGQVVATVGDSGRTSGPHLHFEVRRGGTPVDPLEVLGPVPRPE